MVVGYRVAVLHHVQHRIRVAPFDEEGQAMAGIGLLEGDLAEVRQLCLAG